MPSGQRNNRGQSALEYATVIACIVLALISMQVYIKWGIQGKLKSLADNIGEGQFYSPKNTTGTMTTTVKSKTTAKTRTMDEKQLTKEYYPGLYSDAELSGPDPVDCKTDNMGNYLCADVDGDHKISIDVFGTETLSIVGSEDGAETETVTQKGSETIGPLEKTLFP